MLYRFHPRTIFEVDEHERPMLGRLGQVLSERDSPLTATVKVVPESRHAPVRRDRIVGVRVYRYVINRRYEGSVRSDPLAKGRSFALAASSFSGVTSPAPTSRATLSRS